MRGKTLNGVWGLAALLFICSLISFHLRFSCLITTFLLPFPCYGFVLDFGGKRHERRERAREREMGGLYMHFILLKLDTLINS